MSTAPVQMAALAAFLTDYPDLRMISVDWLFGAMRVQVPDNSLGDWCDALEILPPAESAWEPHRDDSPFDRVEIPATDAHPFSVLTLRTRLKAGRAVA